MSEQSTYTLRPHLPALPDRIKRLPVDHRGYPVPKFVEWIDGKPDFRVTDGRYLVKAVKENLCWICGGQLGHFLAFNIGPMCAINKISAEPPSHKDCAEFAAKACPFLTNPTQKRREHNLPEGAQISESHIARNPGVTLVWITKSYSLVEGPSGEILFQVGEPLKTLWFFEGRAATRPEVENSIAAGCPILEERARADGPEAEVLLARMRKHAEQHYPAA